MEKKRLEKFGKSAGAILSIIALLTWVGTAVAFLSTATQLPSANRQAIETQAERLDALEHDLTYNEEVTLATARYIVGRAHREYTEQGYIYRFALEYILDIHNAAMAIQPDPMMEVLVDEIKALSIKAGG